MRDTVFQETSKGSKAWLRSFWGSMGGSGMRSGNINSGRHGSDRRDHSASSEALLSLNAVEQKPCTKHAELAPSNFTQQDGHEHDYMSTQSNSNVLATVPSPVLCTREGLSSPRFNGRHPSSQVSFRQIEEGDMESLQDLHEQMFPITYEMEFFRCVAHHKGIISWAACETCNPKNVVGFITARIMNNTETESWSVLQPTLLETKRTLVYILTLGVTKEYRNTGVASSLISMVVEHARRSPGCQGIFLHVVAYNQPAIRFYSKLGFMRLRRAPSFYILEEKPYDAYVFVLYLNGGQPPSISLRDWAVSSLMGLKHGFDRVFRYFGGKHEGIASSSGLCR